MNRYENPHWWGSDHDFAWNHVRRAMERELKAGHLDGLEMYPLFDRPYFREFKPTCCLGCGGRVEYGREHRVWDDKLDQCLRAD